MTGYLAYIRIVHMFVCEFGNLPPNIPHFASVIA